MADEQIRAISEANTWCEPESVFTFVHAIIAARDEQWEAMLSAPHEAKTEAEKTAYAFGWWKALEVQRAEAAMQKLVDMSQELGLYDEKVRPMTYWGGMALADAHQSDKHRAALAAAVEALEKDAARYRFLRDNPYFQIEYTGKLTLDEHIDAAMKEKP
jgi:hypothetical protein